MTYIFKKSPFTAVPTVALQKAGEAWKHMEMPRETQPQAWGWRAGAAGNPPCCLGWCMQGDEPAFLPRPSGGGG